MENSMNIDITTNTSSNDMVIQLTSKTFTLVSFKASLSGSQYFEDAILLALGCKDISSINLTRTVYAQIAKKYNTKVTCVEKSIRNAIKDCHTNGGLFKLNNLYHCVMIHKDFPPSNAELILGLAKLILTAVRIGDAEAIISRINNGHFG